jgi:hypothetical protein
MEHRYYFPHRYRIIRNRWYKMRLMFQSYHKSHTNIQDTLDAWNLVLSPEWRATRYNPFFRMVRVPMTIQRYYAHRHIKWLNKEFDQRVWDGIREFWQVAVEMFPILARVKKNYPKRERFMRLFTAIFIALVAIREVDPGELAGHTAISYFDSTALEMTATVAKILHQHDMFHYRDPHMYNTSIMAINRALGRGRTGVNLQNIDEQFRGNIDHFLNNYLEHIPGNSHKQQLAPYVIDTLLHVLFTRSNIQLKFFNGSAKEFIDELNLVHVRTLAPFKKWKANTPNAIALTQDYQFRINFFRVYERLRKRPTITRDMKDLYDLTGKTMEYYYDTLMPEMYHDKLLRELKMLQSMREYVTKEASKHGYHLPEPDITPESVIIDLSDPRHALALSHLNYLTKNNAVAFPLFPNPLYEKHYTETDRLHRAVLPKPGHKHSGWHDAFQAVRLKYSAEMFRLLKARELQHEIFDGMKELRSVEETMEHLEWVRQNKEKNGGIMDNDDDSNNNDVFYRGQLLSRVPSLNNSPSSGTDNLTLVLDTKKDNTVIPLFIQDAVSSLFSWTSAVAHASPLDGNSNLNDDTLVGSEEDDEFGEFMIYNNDANTMGSKKAKIEFQSTKQDSNSNKVSQPHVPLSTQLLLNSQQQQRQQSLNNDQNSHNSHQNNTQSAQQSTQSTQQSTQSTQRDNFFTLLSPSISSQNENNYQTHYNNRSDKYNDYNDDNTPHNNPENSSSFFSSITSYFSSSPPSPPQLTHPHDNYNHIITNGYKTVLERELSSDFSKTRDKIAQDIVQMQGILPALLPRTKEQREKLGLNDDPMEYTQSPAILLSHEDERFLYNTPTILHYDEPIDALASTTRDVLREHASTMAQRETREAHGVRRLHQVLGLPEHVILQATSLTVSELLAARMVLNPNQLLYNPYDTGLNAKTMTMQQYQAPEMMKKYRAERDRSNVAKLNKKELNNQQNELFIPLSETIENQFKSHSEFQNVSLPPIDNDNNGNDMSIRRADWPIATKLSTMFSKSPLNTVFGQNVDKDTNGDDIDVNINLNSALGDYVQRNDDYFEKSDQNELNGQDDQVDIEFEEILSKHNRYKSYAEEQDSIRKQNLAILIQNENEEKNQKLPTKRQSRVDYFSNKQVAIGALNPHRMDLQSSLRHQQQTQQQTQQRTTLKPPSQLAQLVNELNKEKNSSFMSPFLKKLSKLGTTFKANLTMLGLRLEEYHLDMISSPLYLKLQRIVLSPEAHLKKKEAALSYLLQKKQALQEDLINGVTSDKERYAYDYLSSVAARLDTCMLQIHFELKRIYQKPSFLYEPDSLGHVYTKNIKSLGLIKFNHTIDLPYGDDPDEAELNLRLHTHTSPIVKKWGDQFNDIDKLEASELLKDTQINYV